MTTQDTIQTMPLRKLVPSAANIRRASSEAGRAELAASLQMHGLLQNILVRRTGKRGRYEVVAGNRRLSALQQLCKERRSIQGTRVTKDFPVRVIVRNEGSATELSLAENEQREAMHLVDQVSAYKSLVEQGMTADEIAGRFGQSIATVRQRLKLASLSPKLLDAMRAGEVSLEQAKALALADDHQAQETAWFGQDEWSRAPHYLRTALTRDHVRGSNRLARFVGLDAYAAAGGAVLRDLFADDGLTFLTDRPLLVRLATDRLNTIADEVRREGWKWTEISLDPGVAYGGAYGRLYPTRRPFTEAEEAELAAHARQFDEVTAEIDDRAEGDPEIEADEKRLSEIEARILEVEKSAESFAADALACAGALVAIGHDGAVQVMRGLVKPEDRLVEHGAAGEGRAAGRGQPGPSRPKGLPAALMEELTAIRTAALRIELANRPDRAMVALAHALAGPLFHNLPPRSAIKVRGERRRLETLVKNPASQPSCVEWNRLIESWAARLPEDPADFWDWLAGQPSEVVLQLLAVAAAASLDAVEARDGAPFRETAAADGIAVAVALDMTAWWAPQTEFLSRLTKAELATALRESGSASERVASVERSPKADAVIIAEQALQRAGWLPKPLRSAPALPETTATAD